MIGLLLVVVAIVLAIETKSLLLGESATPAAQERIAAALAGTPGVERIIHMKTLHLGPEELLVARQDRGRRRRHGRSGRRGDRAAERPSAPSSRTARVIYLEPDIDR